MRKILAVLAACFLLMNGISHGSGSRYSPPSGGAGGGGTDGSQPVLSLYDQGMEATRSNNFQLAMELFAKALEQDPNNPDILNMLAHSQRKTGHLDDSIANYKKALSIRPHFPEAQEYLGEAYLQGAVQQLNILKDYKDEGKEQVEYLTAAFKAAEKDLQTP